MHMHDWNNYRNQLSAAVTGFGMLSPETVKGYAALGGAGEKTGRLGAMRTLDAFEAASEEQASA
jgi:hypothetical protein